MQFSRETLLAGNNLRGSKEGDWLFQGNIGIVTGRCADLSDGVRWTFVESILAASAEASGIMTPRGQQRQPGHGVRLLNFNVAFDLQFIRRYPIS